MTFGADSDLDPFNLAPRGRPTSAQAAHRSGLSGPDDTSYSVDRFYVASTNEHDHDESTRVRMPKWIAVFLQDLVRDNRLPAYRSVHDVIRDALVHRIHYIHEHDLTEADTDWIEREVLRGAMARIESRRQNKVESVETVDITLKEALRSRDPEELEMAVAVAQGMAEHIGEPYASNIRAMIAQVYSDAQNYRGVPNEIMFGTN